MFCKNCGKEIEENWNTCPNCGQKLKEVVNEIPTVASNQEPVKVVQMKGSEKGNKKKVKKPIFKRIWFWILLIIGIVIIFSMFGGDDETTKTGTNVQNQPVKTIEEVGGLSEWVDSDYKDRVRTEIVVELPITERDADNYCVHLLTSFGDSVFIKQKDGSNVRKWE